MLLAEVFFIAVNDPITEKGTCEHLDPSFETLGKMF